MRLLLFSLVFLIASSGAAADSVLLQPFVSGLDRPVQLVSAHDQSSRLYIAEQPGRILMLDGDAATPRPFLDLTDVVSCCANGGLLSVVFHPRYAENGRLFVQYVDHNGDTAVARYTRSSSDSSVADPLTAQLVLVVPQPKDNLPNHHGGALQFGPDGFLYISIGDGGAERYVSNRAQETHHLLGKMLRIDVDGAAPYAIPPGNPLAGTPGARGEIWALGLRNPWRFSFDRATGDLYIGDVGQNGWEEINVVTHAQSRGANFGWPIMEASHCFAPPNACRTEGLTLPKIEYPRDAGCSVTGGYRYRGTRWPRLRDAYVYADWCTGRLWSATEANGVWSSSATETGRPIVSFGEDDNGELYVVDYSGSVLRLTAPPARRRSAAR